MDQKSESTIQFRAVASGSGNNGEPEKHGAGAAAQQFVLNMQRGQNEVTPPSADGHLPGRAVVNAFGQMLYRIGLQTEYAFIRLGRFTRRTLHFFVRAAAALIRFIAGPLAALLCSIWADLTAPFRQLWRGVHNLFRTVRTESSAGGSGTSAGLAYLRHGAKAYLAVIGGALRYLMPAAALCVLVFTVHTVLSSSFSLGVNYRGNLQVFIENESVWDSAEKLVQERVVASEGAKVEWDEHPQFELRIVDPEDRTDVAELADQIISASSDQIMNAVGLRINGSLIAMVEDILPIRQMLEEKLAFFDDGTHDSVGFLYPIEEVPGTYFTDSVRDTGVVMENLSASELLSVRVMDHIEYDEEIPFDTLTVESDEYVKGTRFVSQYGKSGLQHVRAVQTSVDGEIISIEPTQVDVTREMVPKIITVGTAKPVYSTPGTEGSGSMVFPVPQLSYITTRFGQGGHRGIDLCAPAGTPVVAADGGVVVESGTHWSWGNYVLIDHGNGYTTRYAHCQTLMVPVGAVVTAGQQIGTVGRTGTATGNHVHLELTYNGRLIDPAPFLGV